MVGMLFAGLGLYSVLNVILVVAVLASGMSWTGDGPSPALLMAVVLIVVGPVAGIVLCFVRGSWTRGLGLGLMIGWATWSIVSVGFCTGLNPGLYG
ncbi:hypothetical protein ACIBP6_29965 [Nonomuraea terrae]|uniref:hypothetical protein n=1 Tax=Nonomuraea terrae TaxID=2530383 RepID=UPI00378C24DB